MKNATLPSLRVEPELRQAVEGALHSNETLSSFMEQALQEHVKTRQFHNEFIARGLASREEAAKSGEYYEVDEVLEKLDRMLSDAER